MGAIIKLKINNALILKILTFVGVFLICFFVSIVLWPSIIFRTLEYFQIIEVLGTIKSKSFIRLLFGPITPFIWQIKQLFQTIGNYGLSGISIWFGRVSFIYIIGGFLYLYSFYRTGKVYMTSDIKWNNWKIIILVIFFGLTWFFWGESHMSIGV